MQDARRYRLATAWALVIGPALFLLDNLIHPEEFERGNEAEQLAVIAADAGRWQLAHLIGFASLLAICPAVLGLAWVVRRSQPRLGLWAGAAGLAGLLGFAFAFALDGYTWGVLGEVSGRSGIDPVTIETAFGEIQESSWALPYYALAVLGFTGGLLALAWGLARGDWVSAPAAGLFALGAFAVAIEGLVPSNAYFIASSALFVLGAAGVARELLRVADGRLGGPGTADHSSRSA